MREFISRTNYQVVNSVSSSADATLKGVVVSTLAAPLTYDAQTGRVSSASCANATACSENEF